MVFFFFVLAYPWTLKMEAICSYETSGSLSATRRYSPEDRNLYFIALLIRPEIHGRDEFRFEPWSRRSLGTVTSCCPFMLWYIYPSFSYLFVLKYFWGREPQGIFWSSQGSPLCRSPNYRHTTTEGMPIECFVASFKYSVRSPQATSMCVAVASITTVSTRQRNNTSHCLLVIK
jgi:hypothetical protein